ncbi:protein kinase [Nocardia sp. SYP-A9097]|uniref:serine/threonine-protein kinase n=1 Tax=Nocardia sp. SYP-A9097 TaxID=2663237 RepID=UPI00129BB7B4|nr:serine/threonine-protein kinase [Nocardia sp. SYP-A9097]MRH88861.1 protein kinase [Nocardia sp. SYP-A9097]
MWDGYLGRYRLDEPLGSGGSAQVWRAFDTSTDRTVTLKVLASVLTEDPEYRRRFEREARVAARLHGPHVVAVRAYGELEGRLYIESDFVDGLDIEALLEWEGPFAPPKAVTLITQIASALDEAHSIGLVHRDIKPRNIIVAPDDTAYLIDFGTALEDGQPGITQTGMLVGTPAYMAPERFAGESTSSSDIYALGCVLYECLTGQRPFRARNPAQLMRAHLDAPVPFATDLAPEVPGTLDRVIARAMAKDPAQRYSSAGEFADAVRTAVDAPDSDAATLKFTVATPATALEDPVSPETLAAQPVAATTASFPPQHLAAHASSATSWPLPLETHATGPVGSSPGNHTPTTGVAQPATATTDPRRGATFAVVAVAIAALVVAVATIVGAAIWVAGRTGSTGQESNDGAAATSAPNVTGPNTITSNPVPSETAPESPETMAAQPPTAQPQGDLPGPPVLVLPGLPPITAPVFPSLPVFPVPPPNSGRPGSDQNGGSNDQGDHKPGKPPKQHG